jgi:hypothetical protein
MTYTLVMPNDKSNLTPNNLPVLVCGVIYYNKSKTYRYRWVTIMFKWAGVTLPLCCTNCAAFLISIWRLCTKDGILKGTYGHEQLTPAPQHTAKGLVIFYNKLDKKKIFMMTQAGEKFCPVRRKFSYCCCQKDCSTSKTCKCWKVNTVLHTNLSQRY